jgi:DNA modification methylase
MEWKNRIVGHGKVSPDKLLAHPDNWRVHPKHQQDALKGVIEDIGFIRSVTVNRLTGRVVDGHLRVALALRDGIKQIPVEYVELTEAEEALALLTLDPIAAQAGADKKNMELLLNQVDTDSKEVLDFLSRLAIDKKIDWGNPDQAAEEIKPELAKALQIKWKTKDGQLWGCGKSAGGFRHKIICGDSTDPQVVGRLLERETVDQLNTDPPYGVNLQSKDEYYAQNHKNQSVSGEMINDNIQDYRTFFHAFLKPIPFSKKNTVYIFMQSLRLPQLIQAAKDAGVYLAEDLVWVKSAPVFGRQDYQHQHEWILYGWKGGHEFYRNKGTTLQDFEVDPTTLDREQLIALVKKYHELSDVLREKKNTSNPLHPTMKPVRLVQRLILDGTKRNAIVYDPFSGSGTTSDACENCGRQARAIEMDPRYVAVWCERMGDKMGEKPELIK